MKIIKRIEIILLVAIAIAILLKMLKLPVSGVILTTTMSSIAILYWVFAFRSFKLWKVTKAVSLLNFFFYFFGSFVICGILYLMMFWPGGPTLIYQSFKVYLFLCAFSIIYSFFKYKENKFVLWNNVKIGFQKFSLILVLGFILYLIPNELRIKLFAINPDEARTAIEEFHE